MLQHFSFRGAFVFYLFCVCARQAACERYEHGQVPFEIAHELLGAKDFNLSANAQLSMLDVPAEIVHAASQTVGSKLVELTARRVASTMSATTTTIMSPRDLNGSVPDQTVSMDADRMSTTTLHGSNLKPVVQRQILAWHNYRRCLHGTKPLKWNENLAAFAVKHTKHVKGKFLHSSNKERNNKFGFAIIGENLAFGYDVMMGPKAANMWYDEINKTAGGIVTAPHMPTEHYTQMVWAHTTDIGCGYFHLLMSCNYGPMGNVIGRYLQNVKKPDLSVKAKAKCQKKFLQSHT